MLDTPQNTLPDIWSYHARSMPRKVAFRCGDAAVTWGELGARMNRIANALLGLGLHTGDRVACVMSNSVDYLIVQCGVIKAGLCVVPISTLLAPDQLATLIDNSDAKVLLTDGTYEPMIERILPRLRLIPRERAYSVTFPTRLVCATTLIDQAPTTEPDVKLTFDDLIV